MVEAFGRREEGEIVLQNQRKVRETRVLRRNRKDETLISTITVGHTGLNSTPFRIHKQNTKSMTTVYQMKLSEI